MIEISEIDIKEFENTIYERYTKLFLDEEQREWSKITNTYNQGLEKFYKIVLDNSIIGFFMLEKNKKDYPYYLDYFAIFEEYQNKGYGTKAIKKLLLEIIGNNGLCIEIEKEDNDEPITIKRAKFYKKLGFKRIDSEYLLYSVLYTPYVYNYNCEKETIDKIMFDYYKMNCGEDEMKINCKIVNKINK